MLNLALLIIILYLIVHGGVLYNDANCGNCVHWILFRKQLVVYSNSNGVRIRHQNNAKRTHKVWCDATHATQAFGIKIKVNAACVHSNCSLSTRQPWHVCDCNKVAIVRECVAAATAAVHFIHNGEERKNARLIEGITLVISFVLLHEAKRLRYIFVNIRIAYEFDVLQSISDTTQRLRKSTAQHIQKRRKGKN